jgi:hypothetical protein
MAVVERLCEPISLGGARRDLTLESASSCHGESQTSQFESNFTIIILYCEKDTGTHYFVSPSTLAVGGVPWLRIILEHYSILLSTVHYNK